MSDEIVSLKRELTETQNMLATRRAELIGARAEIVSLTERISSLRWAMMEGRAIVSKALLADTTHDRTKT